MIAACSVGKLTSSATCNKRQCAWAAHKSASMGNEICLDMARRGTIANMLKTHALAETCLREHNVPSIGSYAVSIVFTNSVSSNTGKASRNEDLKNAVITSRVASISGNSHIASERDGRRAEASENCIIGILKSAHDTGWPVLLEIHSRPGSEDMAMPLKYQLGPHCVADL